MMSALKEWGIVLLCWVPIFGLSWFGWHFSMFFQFLIALLIATALLPVLLRAVFSHSAEDTPRHNPITDTDSSNE